MGVRGEREIVKVDVVIVSRRGQTGFIKSIYAWSPFNYQVSGDFRLPAILSVKTCLIGQIVRTLASDLQHSGKCCKIVAKDIRHNISEEVPLLSGICTSHVVLNQFSNFFRVYLIYAKHFLKLRLCRYGCRKTHRFAVFICVKE